MKTFKQLREKWISSIEGGFYGVIDIYINPNMRELRTVSRNGGIRGFIAPNGKVYIGSDGIHHNIHKAIKNEVDTNGSIPFIIDQIEKSKNINNKIIVNLGDFTTKYYHAQDKAATIIKKNRWFKKMFGDVSVYSNFGQSLSEEWMGKYNTTMNQKQFDLFKNPSPKELGEIGNPIRFVFFPDNTLYAWGGFKALHNDVIFEVKRKHSTMKHMIAGTMVRKGNELYIVQSAWDMKQSQFKKQSGNSNYDVDEIKAVLDKSVYFRMRFRKVHVE